MSAVNSTAELSTKDLWTLAKHAANSDAKKTTTQLQGIENTMIVVGSKGSGKTTIILRQTDRDEAPSPTSALEYTQVEHFHTHVNNCQYLFQNIYRFARRTRGMTGVKDVVHMWEVAGGVRLSDLVKIPIVEAQVHTITCVIVVDLSQPDSITSTLDHFITLFAERVESLLSGLEKRGSKRPAALRKQAWKKYGVDHPDQSELKPSLVPLVIIGSKYDVFRDFESETRKLVCKTLRYAAHVFGASLIFTSAKDETSMERCRQLLSHHGFKSNPPKGHIIDHNKAMMVLAGADTLSQIGHPTKSDKESIGRVKGLDWNMWKTVYSQSLPPRNVQDDSLKDIVDLAKYREPAIDNVYGQKEAEFMQRMERQSQPQR
ncbi:hypothetical protein SmJEL517_g03119 [Synchytrium microbalum]|uniref:Cytoplasmic dynein 2 light intermediate chain 1 n=1 Tax=Synchytrium microbalum TaxID=1806994 RepID=A0A507BZC3_9FUNG|nr:uncharacterized protein SmJEL517_g03119 [Synchytrium microbalum]TPX34147.1 hypothetical protein SmJEL517_g03119 [Synchytrium microbalum]